MLPQYRQTLVDSASFRPIWRPMKNLLSITSALGLVISTLAPAATPVTALPRIINTPGTYYLTCNLTAAPGQGGVLITSGNVILDLKGFTLSNAGVTIQGSNVTVRNGTLSGSGISACPAFNVGTLSGIVVDRVTLSNIEGTQIDLCQITSSSVTNCSFLGFAQAAIYDHESQPTNCSRNKFDGKQNMMLSVIYPPGPVMLQQATFVTQ